MTKQTTSIQNSLKVQFYKNFIKTPYGYMKLENDFSSFVILNKEYLSLISIFGELPPNVITFYQRPNFEDFQTYKEMINWLERHGSYPNKPMKKEVYEITALSILRKYIKEMK